MDFNDQRKVDSNLIGFGIVPQEQQYIIYNTQFTENPGFQDTRSYYRYSAPNIAEQIIQLQKEKTILPQNFGSQNQSPLFDLHKPIAGIIDLKGQMVSTLPQNYQGDNRSNKQISDEIKNMNNIHPHNIHLNLPESLIDQTPQFASAPPRIFGIPNQFDQFAMVQRQQSVVNGIGQQQISDLGMNKSNQYMMKADPVNKNSHSTSFNDSSVINTPLLSNSPTSYHSDKVQPVTPHYIEYEDEYHKAVQKRANHNIIERRRRDVINDCIKELNGMIPINEPECRRHKGAILKATIEYIKSLESTVANKNDLENKLNMLASENSKLKLKIKELELIIKGNGLGDTVTTLSECKIFQLIKNMDVDKKFSSLKM